MENGRQFRKPKQTLPTGYENKLQIWKSLNRFRQYEGMWTAVCRKYMLMCTRAKRGPQT